MGWSDKRKKKQVNILLSGRARGFSNGIKYGHKTVAVRIC